MAASIVPLTATIALVAYALMVTVVPVLIVLAAAIAMLKAYQFVLERRMMARKRAAIATLDVLYDLGLDHRHPSVGRLMQEYGIGPDVQEDGE